MDSDRMKSAIGIGLIVVAMVVGSGVIHVGMGYVTSRFAADQMKVYNQQWAEDRKRVETLQQEIQDLEKKRAELLAESAKLKQAATAAATQGFEDAKELDA